jgi:hypothetical protein
MLCGFEEFARQRNRDERDAKAALLLSSGKKLS